MATMTAPDGSTWGFARAGRRGGKPVAVHHGLIANARLDDQWVGLADAAGIEFIVIERPGYGETPPRSMDRIADWAGLIETVMEALDVRGRVDAVGISAGAPYAYALAAGMPARVGKLCILSGVPFITVPEVLACYSAEDREAYDGYASQSLAELRQVFAAYCQNLANRLGGDRFTADSMAAIMRHGCSGPAREAKLQSIDWGFERSAIQCPVHLWHSRDDDMVPFDAAKRSMAGLPDATLHVQEEPSHFASLTSLKEMLSVLSS